MLDPFDFKEPSCALCGGKEFYYTDKDAPLGRIPVDRIIQKIDECYNRNDIAEAGRLLEYWQREALQLKDMQGELSVDSELVGYYRKTREKDKAINVIGRAIELIEILGQKDNVSGATIYLNIATTLKSFDLAKEAMPYYRHCEKVYKEKLSLSDENFGGLYNNMALCYVDLEDYDMAEKCYNFALEVMKKCKNRQTEVAITYVNMAHMFDKSKLINKRDKIIDCMNNAREMLDDESVVRNGHYAFVCEKCAPSFEDFGDSVTAKNLFKMAKEIYERN